MGQRLKGHPSSDQFNIIEMYNVIVRLKNLVNHIIFLEEYKMKVIEFDRKNLNKSFFKDILFFMIAEGGAMGEPGAINFIKADGKMYHLNYVYGSIKIEEIYCVFPILKECKFEMFGMNSKNPDGWKYVSLGMGNHLIVKNYVNAQFQEQIRKYKSEGEIYQNWSKLAKYIIDSKGDVKMKNNTTELVFILDRSGSMSGLESDTIGGFNAMIDKQKKQDGECYVSTVLFDNVSEVLHDRVKLADIKPMTDNEYTVRGCTALIDAIGGAIHHIGNVHKYARKEDVPEHTVFVITTDGMENASRKYSSDKVKRMIERQKEEHGWEFLFIGANIDAVETAAQYGIDKDKAVNYNADKIGTEILYQSVSAVVGSVRANKCVDKDWSKELNEDYKRRGKKN